MKLVLNVKITNHRIGYPYDSGRGSWQPRSDRFDIFKYCLASYAALDPLVQHYHFYITLADEFVSRQDELELYINQLFPSHKLSLTWVRNNYTRDWRKACNDILSGDDNEVIWFAGNDDHIFIDYNLDVVEAAINILQEELDPYAVVYYSHWPEQMRMSKHFNGELTKDRNFIKFPWDNFDGIHMFKAARFKRYWYDADYGDALIFRPDDLYNHYGYRLPSTYYSPTRELVRHYDGYVHVGTPITNYAPPLFIPPGFFDCSMKIRIGYTDRDNCYTNFNPAAPALYNVDQTGTDYRFLEEDIPLFWQNRIKQIVYAPNYDAAQMCMSRNEAFLAVTHVPMSCFGQNFSIDGGHPVSHFLNHLRKTTNGNNYE